MHPAHAPNNLQGQLRSIRRTVLIAVAVVVLLCCLAVVAVLYISRSKQSNPANAQDSQAQMQHIVAATAKLYLVPTNETPTVAKIQDTSKLDSAETFYQKAQNGDYVLVYSKAKLALLYRPSANKLVNVSLVATAPSGAAAPTTDSAATGHQPAAGQ